MPSPARQAEQEPHIVELPKPSLVPLFTALGLATAMIGLIASWPVIVVGGVIFLAAVIRWVSSVFSDIDELPE